MKNEIIFYQPDGFTTQIEVRLDELNETFWLSLNQISELFERDKSVISRHLKNIFKDNELDKNSVVAFFATTASDGKTYNVEYFNLDAILSVGYRVNSKRGTQFRVWASSVLRDYLMKGYAISQRMNRVENNLENLNQKVEAISLQIQSNALPSYGVFFDGQVFDAYELTSKLIRTAKKSILLIDNYIDENTLTHLAKKDKGVSVTLLTKNNSKQLDLDVKKANEQYGNFTIKTFSKSHDRFLIIDETAIYHLGASLKDLGKKWFAFSKMDTNWIQTILNAIDK